MKAATVTFDNGSTVFTAVTWTAAEMVRGLAGIDHLAQDAGMLLYYGIPTRASIWMKGMKIPLDIIFISQNKIVRSIASDVPASSRDIYSVDGISSVLEVNAGWCALHEVTVGAHVTIRFVDRDSNPIGTPQT
jgi:uncharacterized protein